jgi:UDP-N-acetylmuramyl pentapeptide phosphotransferase/UDP-N-acetylglucosamine-1-phosphate transferase
VIVGVAFVLAVVVGAALRRATAELFSAPVFESRNHRGSTIPAGVGVLVAVVALACEAVFVAADRTGHGPEAVGGRRLILIATVAFALLGILDDLAARGSDRGFRGHLRALAGGRLTTGGLKLVGGGLVAFVVSGVCNPTGIASLLVDTALIALCANLANLLDRAPGRTTKVGISAFVALALATGVPRELAGVAVVVGAVAVLLPGDLAERFMLGDAGANALGAALGVGLVLTAGLPARVSVLVVVAALNLLSEQVSFTKVIEATPVLRWLDRLGRKP